MVSQFFVGKDKKKNHGGAGVGGVQKIDKETIFPSSLSQTHQHTALLVFTHHHQQMSVLV